MDLIVGTPNHPSGPYRSLSTAGEHAGSRLREMVGDGMELVLARSGDHVFVCDRRVRTNADIVPDRSESLYIL